MAVITEFYTIRDDGVKLHRTYSDSGMKIRKVGTDEVYDDAIDIETCGFEYEETNVPVDFSDSEFRQMVEGAL